MLKNIFLNKYFQFTIVLFLTFVFLFLTKNRLGTIIDLDKKVREEEIAKIKMQQKKITEMGLKKDPSQLSYVEIIEKEDYNLYDTEVLKNKDTDHDGLNDYDEIYIYKTSAYIEDTDGDGDSDKYEIDQGTDPLCPKGKICGLTDDLNKEKDVQLENAENLNFVKDSDLSALSNVDLMNIDINILKQALLDSGVSEEELAKFSDDELRQMYIEALKSQQKEETATETVQISEEDLDKLGPDEIRAILLKQGMDKAKLDQLSDEELMKLYEDTLEELK